MKALVVYESMFGNTKQVAQAIADGMRPWFDVDVVDAADAPQAPGPDVAMVVAGGPTHALSMTRARSRADAIQRGAKRPVDAIGLREWLGRQPQTARAPIATFDTRATKGRRLPGSAAKAAARSARRHGYVSVARPQTFWVQDTQGPLVDGELDRARDWGRELATSVAHDRSDEG